ncbi:hypothetical protein [Streptomyces sp. NPDC055929]|uniref:hypothetical protein n=1 Tax=Streptomyces sp. NPDC055929 TaxID=3345662 RepID=UPI0035E1FD48
MRWAECSTSPWSGSEPLRRGAPVVALSVLSDAQWPESSPCCRTGLRPRRTFLIGVFLCRPGGEHTLPGPVNRRCITTRYEKTSIACPSGLHVRGPLHPARKLVHGKRPGCARRTFRVVPRIAIRAPVHAAVRPVSHGRVPVSPASGRGSRGTRRPWNRRRCAVRPRPDGACPASWPVPPSAVREVSPACGVAPKKQPQGRAAGDRESCVEARTGTTADQRQEAGRVLADAVKDGIGLTVAVEVTAPHTLERSAGKIRRIVDLRDAPGS